MVAGIVVVDVARIFADSIPAQLGRKHLEEVQKTLKKGLDDVVDLYKNNVASPDAQNAIGNARNLLQRQMNVEQQAVNAVVRKELEAAVLGWREKNPEALIVLNRQLALAADDSVDVTDEVMIEMNRRTPTFPSLPTVTINRPQQK